jgi:hypothetical protein
MERLLMNKIVFAGFCLRIFPYFRDNSRFGSVLTVWCFGVIVHIKK